MTNGASAVRLVLDTNVMVAAQRSPRGASARLVLAARDRRIVMLVSVALFVEYEAVLTREDQLAPSGVTRQDVLLALDALVSVIEPVEVRYLWRPQVSDPDDDMVLEAAANGRADAIVTFEVTTFQQPASTFGIQVMTPGDAWRKIIAT